MPVVPRHERRMADGRVSRGPDLAPLVWLLNAAVLGVLVVAPLAILVAASLSTREGLSFANFAAAFGRPLYRGPIVNSLVYASAVAVLSVGIGAPMAWLVGRTDLPGKGLIRTLTIGAFVTPSFLGATAWVILAGPNAGLLNVLYRAFTGA